VALKKLNKVDDEGYNVERAWELEAEALDGIRPLKSDHLVRLITAFKRGDEHYIVLEWAQGGNLKQFWEERGSPNQALNEDEIRAYLVQLRGLSGALNQLHTDKLFRHMTGIASASNTSKGLLTATNGLSSASQPQRGSHVRHGDLKPDNVLNFARSPKTLGILKIADLGLAKEHLDPTGRRTQATKANFGTTHYEPPQVIIASHVPRSRLYDIWSMGCIIFESVIWMLYGREGLEMFWKQKVVYKSKDSLYFTTNSTNTNATLSNVVSSLISFILDSEREKSKGSPSMVHDLLVLVRDGLLVVDLPRDNEDPRLGGGRRIRSDRLHSEMQRIVKQAERSTYLNSAKRGRLPIPQALQSSNLGLLKPATGNSALSTSGRQVSFLSELLKKLN